MKTIGKFQNLYLAFLCILAFAGCSGLVAENTEEETPKTPSITFTEVLEQAREFDMDGGQFSLSFTSTLDWKIVVEGNTKSVGWINVAPSSGKAGKAKVAVTIQANNGYEDRSAIVSVNSGDLSESFEISQTAKEMLEISTSSVDIDYHSQTFDITLTSNVEYQVQIADKCISWLHLQENTKSVPTDTILTFVADKNEEILPRDGSIVITDGKKTLTVKVNQKGDTSIQEREKEILHELREALSINNSDFEYWGQPWDPSIPVEQWARVKFENGYVTEIICPQYKSYLAWRIYYLGKIPASIGELSHLKTLIIGDVNLGMTEPIPAEIGNLESLEVLSISGVNVPGPIPSEIGNLKNLKELTLSTSLSVMNLSGKPFDPDPFVSKSPLPESIGNLTNLEKLFVSWQIEGDLPQGLGNLSKLKELEIYINGWYLLNDYETVEIATEPIGIIPESISGMKSLQRLALSGGFSGVLPEGIGGLSSLENLSISSPFLTGSIPSSLCNLKNLKFFDLYAQQMSGGLPENIGNLSSLESLVLRGRFSGPIHESIGNCKNLRMLSVDADFTSFPGSLSFMLDNKDNCNTNGDVGRFNIGGNRMSGKIPSEIVNHKNFYLFAPNFLQRQQDGYGFDLDGFRIPACREKYTDLIGGGTIDFDKIYKENKYTLVLRYDDLNMDFVNPLLPIVKRLAQKYPGLKVVCSYVGNPDAATVKSFAAKTGMSQFPHIKDGMGWGTTNNLFYNDTDSCRQSSPTLGVIDSEGYYKLIWCNGWYPRMTSQFDQRIKDQYFVDTEHLEEAVSALFE